MLDNDFKMQCDRIRRFATEGLMHHDKRVHPTLVDVARTNQDQPLHHAVVTYLAACNRLLACNKSFQKAAGKRLFDALGWPADND